MLVVALGVSAANSGSTGGNSGNTGNESTSITGKLENPFSGAGNSLIDLFNAIINKILLPVGSIIAVVAFIWTGFLFVTAQGNETKLDTAKRALLYVAIGTALLLGASMLAKVITNTVKSLES